MSDQIATQGVHHFRLTVSNVDRAVRFYTEILGFNKLMDLNPGAFLSNGAVGLGIGPHPYPEKAMSGDRFDENRIGLDHMSLLSRRGQPSTTPSGCSTGMASRTARSEISARRSGSAS